MKQKKNIARKIMKIQTINRQKNKLKYLRLKIKKQKN